MSTPMFQYKRGVIQSIGHAGRIVLSSTKYFFKQITERKPMRALQAEIDTQLEFRRTLNWFHLLAIGVGTMIGAGIFVLSGTAASSNAGPSVIISFVLTGVIAFFATLSFSELGTMMPLSGSAYTYTYAALGEYLAWFIGWNSALIYLFGVLTVSVSWSKYIVFFIDIVSGYSVKSMFAQPPVSWNETTEVFIVTGQIVNLPAMVIVVAFTVILIIGIRETAIANLVLVVIKVTIIFIFIFACCKYVNPKNYEPFFPSNLGSFSKYGIPGMLQASTLIFFAYVGFDSVATVAQEVKSPERSLPIALIGSNIISLLLYVGICTVMVGLVSYEQLNSNNPLSVAIQATPYGLWLRIVMTLGGIASLTTVGMTAMLSQTRIFYAMAHDGLLPPLFCKLHSTRITPWISTLISGIFCAAVSGFFPVDILGETTAIGALITYIFVHISVVIMRFTHKDMPRGFEVPCGRWLIPTIGSLLCMLLMKGVSKATAFRFLAWTILGQIFYFSYGYRHSKQRRLRKNEESNSIVVLVSNPENNIDVYTPDEL
ncbi:unnamed protein product [Rotaria magnacalcarata]|uniref:Uncharacterized protein n=2 Tax=Rotaria magnacalcarata TaxID=392030 RepID=A0A816YJ32_9BILA|nr:unnamed protein product [Rotaria magnacalcarata]CAF2159763.1 unnamed protein product [Rotaria magnacalcarata]CAF4164328.1 unnamed protein product [Rotaria magnacalcarata]CAF4485522.1 unnamed protein product [Rotaria magnacalcarata]CAF4523737.1 unnamed protein product [Rotaria magnacalcarata]